MAKRVIYEDIAIGAKEDCTVASTGSMNVSENEQTIQDITPVNYITFENNGVYLEDNTSEFYESGDQIGYISNLTSNSGCSFETPPTITFTFSNKYSSDGITLYFLNNYCRNINIKYYDGETLLNDKDYICEELIHFFPSIVQLYNKIVIAFQTTEMPYQFCKFYRIDFGREVEFKDFYSLNLLEEASPISDDLAINTLDFDVMTEENLLVQEGQDLYLYKDDNLLGKFIITNSQQDTDIKYNIKSYDDTGALDNIIFNGGIYNDYSVSALINDISSVSGINISLDSYYSSANVSGWLPMNTCRYAILQIAFAIGAVIDTSRNGITKFTKPQTEVSSIIDNDRILGTAKFEKKEVVTKVNLTKFSYISQTTETENLFNGNADNQTIKFYKPMQSITSGSSTPTVFHPNYMVINGTGLNIDAYPYTEVKTIMSKVNTNITASTKENIKEYNQYTLSSSIVNKIDDLFKYELSRGKITAKVILNDEKVGDLVTVKTLYSGEFTGIISSLSISVNADLVADMEVIEWVVEE